MKGFILLFRSEFYKTRKTMGFWSAVLLPLALCLLLFIGFFNKSEHLANMPGNDDNPHRGHSARFQQRRDDDQHQSRDGRKTSGADGWTDLYSAQ